MTPRLIYLQHLFLSSCLWNCDECQPGFSIISIKLPVFPPPLLKLETSVLSSMGMGEHILPSSYNIKNYLEKLQIILLKKKQKTFISLANSLNFVFLTTSFSRYLFRCFSQSLPVPFLLVLSTLSLAASDFLGEVRQILWLPCSWQK